MENFSDKPETKAGGITPEEALAAEKEIFMTSGGVKIGQSMEDYKAERKELWEKMHPGLSPEEALAIEKEIFMTSGGRRVDQTMEEYMAEREEIWKKMHPEK